MLEIANKYNDDNIDYMIGKIFKFANKTEKQYIKSCIMTPSNINTRMSQIHNILQNYNTRINTDEHRQNYIAAKIYNCLNSHYKHLLKDDMCIMDFGGGNGDVLSTLSNTLKSTGIKISKKNCICVETKTDWVEEYTFDKTDITYMFWDNNVLSIKDNYVDILLCMVSMHHMTDETIHRVFVEAKRALKPGGLLLLKEHDNNAETNNYIEWEHHLYHILDCIKSGNSLKLDTYIKNSHHNFKNKQEWLGIIKSHGFNFKCRYTWKN